MAAADRDRARDAGSGRNPAVHQRRGGALRTALTLLAALALAVGPLAARARDGFAEGLRAAEEHVAAGRLEEAVRDLQAVERADLAPVRRAYLHVRIAEVRRLQCRFTRALSELDAAAAELSTDRDDRILAVYLEGVRAQIYHDQGLLDVARGRLQEMRRRLRELAADGIEPEPERVHADYVEAALLATQEDWETLEAFVEHAVEDPLYADRPVDLAKLLGRLGVAYAEQARLEPKLEEKARETLEYALSEEGLLDVERVQLELALADLALRHADVEEAGRRLEAAADHMGPEETRDSAQLATLWTTTHARWRLATDASRAVLESVRATLLHALDRELTSWLRREVRPGGYGFLQTADEQSLLSELTRVELLIDEDAGAERALAHLLRVQDVGTLVRSLGGVETTLERVRAALVGDGAIALWLPAPDRSHLFLITAETVEHYPLEPHDRIEVARRALERDLQAPLPAESPEWRTKRRAEALATLRDALIPAAVAERLRGHALTLVGADLLGEVPFEALPLGAGFLGTEVAVARLPSLSLGLLLARRAAREELAGPGGMLLVAAPDPHRLDGDRGELEAMLAAYPPAERDVRIGRRATFAGLREGAVGARVAQLFTHGGHDAARERPATLELAAGEGTAFVGADELEALDAPPLVLLTVCRSGQAPKRRGDAGAADLAGALFRAGERARCVILSAYDLEVEAARRLSTAFHAGLAEGASPAEALRRARAELAADERFADPFYHGLIRAVGAAHAPVFRARPR